MTRELNILQNIFHDFFTLGVPYSSNIKRDESRGYYFGNNIIINIINFHNL